MNKNLSFIILGIVPLFSYSENFNVIISKDKSNYDVSDYIDTGLSKCNVISPNAIEIYKDQTFTQNFNDCQKEQTNGTETRWVDIDSYSETKKGTLLLANCSQIFNGNHGDTNGVYEVLNNGASIDVLCDMTTDGGGWTLVSYLGKITGSKRSVTGNTVNGTWEPLFFNFGTYDVNAQTTRSSFSKFDLFKNESNPNDEFLSKRTSNTNNMLIFPLGYTSWWGRNSTEGHFTIDSSNSKIDYLKLTNSGNNNWKTVKNLTSWFLYNGGRTSGTYPGIGWNNPSESNAHVGNDFDTNINHRALLYWESEDSTINYTSQQWFHGQPLQMSDSTEADNDAQDLEFWYRKK